MSQGLREPVRVRGGTFQNPAFPPSHVTGHRQEPVGGAWGLPNPLIRRKEVCVCVCWWVTGGSPAEVMDLHTEVVTHVQR